MGVSVEAWRARIGLFNSGGISQKASQNFGPFAHQASCAAMTLALINIPLLIGCIETNPGPDGLQCSLCNKKYNNISSWALHQESHATDKKFSFSCFQCNDRFLTAAAFNIHFSRFHKKTKHEEESPAGTSRNTFAGVVLSASYTCTVPTCSQDMRNFSLLRKHLLEHLRKGFVVLCPCQPCDKRFTKVSTFQVHVSRYHSKVLEEVVQEPTAEGDEASATAESGCQIPDSMGKVHFSDEEEEECNEESGAEESSGDETGNGEDCSGDDDDGGEGVGVNVGNDISREDIYPENLVRNFVGKFYLMLEGELLVSKVKVQRICEGFAQMCRMSHHRIKVALQAKHLRAGLSKEESEDIINTALKKDTVYATHHKKMDVVDVTTNHNRENFYKRKCVSLDPNGIFLGVDEGKRRYAHYVAITDTLQSLFSDSSVQEHVDASFERKPQKGVYQDFTDGSTFTKHPICANVDCIQLLFFQDAFEFHPLSPVAGMYKCVGFYFTLGNIHPNSRSQVGAIQLALLVREKDLKYFTPEKCLEELIKELKKLTENGIMYKGRKLPVVFMHLCGDNLGQNFIGRYIECFTSDYSCRFCEIINSQISVKPYHTLPLRTPDDYNKAAAQVDPHNPQQNVKGIKGQSVLNDIPNFHVCNPGQPPCCGHDILEGIAKNDLALYLRYFIEIKKWFSLSQLNGRFANFKCQGRDAADKMLKIDPALKKIRGHASEIWLLIRMLPFLISDCIPEINDPVWQLYLQLKLICEYTFAPKISEKQVAKLQELINLYVETRSRLFTRKIQPKHHLLCHYPVLITMFGPLIRLWTMRFESRHVFSRKRQRPPTILSTSP